MKYNDLINELLDLLDKNNDIKKIKILKEKLLSNQFFLGEINNYQNNPTVENKKKLYNNNDYVNYLKLETNINLLIREIKQKLNFLNRSCFK